LGSAPGSVGQVRESAALLVARAKASGVACFLIGHVTKEGTLAGPRVLEHLVDTVLYFEGDGAHALRVLRAVKNRFGSTNEVAVFEMGEGGLVEVPNPSAAFLAERPVGAAGSAVLATLEGSRPVLVEIQALVSRSGPGRRARSALRRARARMTFLVLFWLNVTLLAVFGVLLTRQGLLGFAKGGKWYLTWFAVGLITLMDELTSIFYAPAEAHRFI